MIVWVVGARIGWCWMVFFLVANGLTEASGFEESMRFKKLTNAQRSGSSALALRRENTDGPRPVWDVLDIRRNGTELGSPPCFILVLFLLNLISMGYSRFQTRDD